MRRTVTFLRRSIVAGRILTSDKRIPKPIRWVTRGLIVGCMFIPGPFDEIALVLILAGTVILWRTPCREAWINSA
jgi:hypothetical protein